MGKVQSTAAVNGFPVPHPPADYAAALAEIAALRAEAAALRSRSGGRSVGWHARTVPVPKKAGSRPGRFLGDRVLTGGVVLSLYVGANGKLTFGGGFGSRGFGLWGGERDTFCTYAERGDLRADLFRTDLSAVIAPAWVPGGDE